MLNVLSDYSACHQNAFRFAVVIHGRGLLWACNRNSESCRVGRLVSVFAYKAGPMLTYVSSLRQFLPPAELRHNIFVAFFKLFPNGTGVGR